MVSSVQQAERRTPRVADQDDLLAAKAPSEMIHDSVEVGDMLVDGQAPSVRLWIEGTPCTALIPVDHDEMCFEFAVEIAEQWSLGPTRSAMQPEQHGGSPIRATGQQIELCAVHQHVLRTRDRSPF